ncbi:MAG: type II secretion system minor pseudopilin GspK [Polaromonas sp.]|nr:type II secretion system minor pseudopilin GspK [Polaromonas sp.]
MSPSLPRSLTACSSLPSGRANFSRGGPSEGCAPTLVASRTALPPEGANFSRGGPSKNCAKVRRQAGAALLAAMLTVTLVATFAAAALWQQFRSVEVEGAERIRVQSGWILTGALDWARLILREDARSGGADHLAEPWAVPLNEARLSSFLAVDKTVSDKGNERDAFLSGQVSDLQARLNVTNLIDGNALSEPALNSFARLFDLLGLPAAQLSTLSAQMLIASRAAVGASDAASSAQTPMMPQRVDQLVWLGLSPDVLALLSPYITLLPQRTPVNLNTASAEVIYASTPGLELADAQKLIAARERNHFRTLAEAGQQIGGAVVRFDEGRHSVASRFFEVRGRLRLDEVIVQERSVLQRDGLNVRTLWRDRGVVTDVTVPVPGTAPRS